jgi:hypothetical protein
MSFVRLLDMANFVPEQVALPFLFASLLSLPSLSTMDFENRWHPDAA